MSYTQPPGWWQASDGYWYAPELHPGYSPPEVGSWLDELAAPPGEFRLDTPDLSNSPDRRRKSETPLNELYVVAYRGGWIGMLAGENQMSALRRAMVEINGSGFRVVAAVEEGWSIWKHLGVALLYLVTLGFVGRVRNVTLITEQMR
jgi:hypothetical protein